MVFWLLVIYIVGVFYSFLTAVREVGDASERAGVTFLSFEHKVKVLLTGSFAWPVVLGRVLYLRIRDSRRGY